MWTTARFHCDVGDQITNLATSDLFIMMPGSGMDAARLSKKQFQSDAVAYENAQK